MSIAWQTVQNALHAWVVAGSGLAASQVLWAGQSPKPPSSPFASLRLTGVRRIGFDDGDWKANPLSFTAKTISAVNTTTNVLTSVAHALLTGDGPVHGATTGTWTDILDGSDLRDFWIIKLTADTFKLAISFPDAMNGVAYDIATAGTGTKTIVATADTVRQGQEILYTSRGQRECTVAVQAYGGAAAGATNALAMLNGVVSNSNSNTRRDAFAAAGIGMARVDPIRSLDAILGQSVFDSRALLEAHFFLAEEVSEAITVIDYVEVKNIDDPVVVPTFFVPEDPNP